VLRAWLATLRLTLVIDPALASLASGPRAPWVLVFWHGQQLPLLRWASFRGVVALVSLSLDGELVGAALPRLGVGVVRGSSSRGGAVALRSVARALRDGSDVAVAVDGPRGPPRVVRAEGDRAGAAVAARLGGALVVPMAAACSSRRALATWDAFELPRPFARVVVALGPPLAPSAARPDAMREAIDAACATAAAVLGGASPLPGPDAAHRVLASPPG
jgi:hypothetical protein